MTEEAEKISAERLDSLMPEGDQVHTFVFGGIMIGADWDRHTLLELARKNGAQLVGGVPSAMGHGAAVFRDNGKPLFVETK